MNRVKFKLLMTNLNDVDRVTEAIYVLGGSLMGVAKYIAFMLQRSQLQKFIADLQIISNADKSDEQMEFHMAAERKSQITNRIYFTLMLFSSSLFLITPAIILLIRYVRGTLDLNKLPLPFPLLHNLNVDTNNVHGYLLIYAGCIVFLLSLPIILMTIDLLFLNTCYHIVANCVELKFVLAKIDRVLESDRNAPTIKEEIHQANLCLKQTINLHYGTLR